MRNSELLLFSQPEIIKEVSDNDFIIKLSSQADSPLYFEPGLSKREMFTSSPSRLTSLKDVLVLPRYKYIDGENFVVSPLVKSWSYYQDGGLIWLGTNDHHELLYFLKQSKMTSENDVLLNFDAHDDISQSLPGTREETIEFSNFVGMGFSSAGGSAWSNYVLIAPDSAHCSGMKYYPDKSFRYDQGNIELAMEKAFDLARMNHGKVIFTLDFDYFGSIGIGPFNERLMNRQLPVILERLHKNRGLVKLAHISESLLYCKKQNAQVEEIYNTIIKCVN